MLSVEDQLIVQQTLIRYTHYLDYQQLDKMTEIWAADCLFKADQPFLELRGLDELMAMFEKNNKTLPSVRHIVSNVFVEGNDHTATLYAYVQAVDFKTQQLLAGGRYRDILVKNKDGWRIQEKHYTAG